MSNTTTATIRLALISHFARSTRLKVRYFLLRFPPLIGTLFVSDFLGSVVLENLVPESRHGGHHCLLKAYISGDDIYIKEVAACTNQSDISVAIVDFKTV